jgi:hypothetical protein
MKKATTTTEKFTPVVNQLFKTWEQFWQAQKNEKQAILKAFRKSKAEGVLEFQWLGFSVCDPILNVRLENKYTPCEGAHPTKKEYFAFLEKCNKKFGKQPFYIVAEGNFNLFANWADKINNRENCTQTEDFVTIELYRNY